MSCHQRRLGGSLVRLITTVVEPLDRHVLRVCAVGVSVRLDFHSHGVWAGHDGDGLGILTSANLPHNVASRPERWREQPKLCVSTSSKLHSEA